MSRAEDNDVMRRRNSFYEIDDPRNDRINTDPDRRDSAYDLHTEDRHRFLDDTRVHADADFVVNCDETPRDERVIEFQVERFWHERGQVTSLAARYTTEASVADPNDEGFLLWFPVVKIDVLATNANSYRVAVDKRLYDRWEIEGLIPVNPRVRRPPSTNREGRSER